MEYTHHDDLVVVTTPLHHTSFRNIMALFVKPENIHIIKMDSTYTKIERIPDVKKCDVVIITHLFGMDVDVSELYKFKNKHSCIFLEDRVQGGYIGKNFSDEIFDIAMYSCGMDKRPVALGGAFMNIKRRDITSDIPSYVIYKTGNYKEETRIERLLFLLKKTTFSHVFVYRPEKLSQQRNFSCGWVWPI